MSEHNKNQLVNEFLDIYFAGVKSDIKDIFEQYYKHEATYDQIGLYYNITRQAVQQKVATNIKNMRIMLEGKRYKCNYASAEIIKLKVDMENVINDNYFFNVSDLKDKCDIDFTETKHNIKIYLSILNIYTYFLEESYLLSYNKHTTEYLDRLYKAIINILNENVLGIDEFTLVTKVKKELNNNKINNKEIISLCEAIKTIEVDNNIYRLILNKLTSYDKKAMRILSENNKPMDGREIATSIFNQSNDVYTDEKVRAVINAMTKNKFIVSIGKTGLWMLDIWEYEANFHTEIIKKVFQNENRALTSREIYAKVCSERPDLNLNKIQSYLYSNDGPFLHVNTDLFIISAWKKKFKKEINKYQSIKNTNKNFEPIVLGILEQIKKIDINDMIKRLEEVGVILSEGRIREKLKKLGFVSVKREGKKFYYYLNDKKDDHRKKFLDEVMALFREVKNGIENRGAHITLKDNDKPKGETAIQVALYEMMRGYLCKDDIDVSREAWTGRGPVDFKFSRGFNLKIFL